MTTPPANLPSDFEGWTVYQNPHDYPDARYVVRRWRFGRNEQNGVVVSDPKPCYAGDSLEDARASVPPGRVQLSRDGTDDPNVLEIWV